MSSELSDPSCRRCPLWASATNVCILGDGPITSSVLVLGIAPGQVEDKTGHVFQGKSGKLLRGVLFDNGLDVRIENIVRCRPPENRDPTKDEQDACRPYLERVVAQMENLKFVVALGALPMKACGVTGSVIELAGVPRPAFAFGRELTVIPIMHPAGLLRRPSYISTWESHWHQIRELVHPRKESFSDTVGAKLYLNGLDGKDWKDL